MKKNFTLVELVTVMAIIGITASLLYSIFFLNWSAFENQIAEADLWQEAQEIIQRVSFDIRVAKRISSLTPHQVVISFPDNSTSTYTITSAGIFQITHDNQTTTLSTRLDPSSSCFLFNASDCSAGESVNNVRSLKLELNLQDNILGKKVNVDTSIQLFCRNRL